MMSLGFDFCDDCTKNCKTDLAKEAPLSGLIYTLPIGKFFQLRHKRYWDRLTILKLPAEGPSVGKQACNIYTTFGTCERLCTRWCIKLVEQKHVLLIFSSLCSVAHHLQCKMSSLITKCWFTFYVWLKEREKYGKEKNNVRFLGCGTTCLTLVYVLLDKPILQVIPATSKLALDDGTVVLMAVSVGLLSKNGTIVSASHLSQNFSVCLK